MDLLRLIDYIIHASDQINFNRFPPKNFESAVQKNYFHHASTFFYIQANCDILLGNRMFSNLFFCFKTVGLSYQGKLDPSVSFNHGKHFIGLQGSKNIMICMSCVDLYFCYKNELFKTDTHSRLTSFSYRIPWTRGVVL